MTQMVICRGLPASGKTTFARTWVAEDPKNRARVNKDDLRRLLHDGIYLGKDTENTVNMIRDNMIRSLLKKGTSVISDDTNLPQPVARDIARIGREFAAEVVVEDFTHVPIGLCVQRDLDREHTVGEGVINKMAKKYIAGKNIPLPFPEDAVEKKGSSPTLRHYVASDTLPLAWMVDIDGTLAHMNGRGPFEWGRVGEDLLNQSVATVVQALQYSHYFIVIMSGRDSVCRPETEEWLHRHGIHYDALIMRAEGDNRNDGIIKHELFWEHVAPEYSVMGVLDDRNRVVEMWRSIGLPCFQVAPGDF